MFTKSLALFLFPALAAAQYYGPPPGPPAGSSDAGSGSATSTALVVAPTAPANTPGQMNIDVAFNGTYAFHPPNITAPVGTLVTFYFPNSPITHSVTQSSFANPCTYLAANATTNSSAGFDSNLQSAATFTLNITDTSPIWYYCKQFMHCGMGMVGSINAVGDTYTTYLNTALGIGSNEMLTPNNGPPVVAGVHATATGPPVSDISGTSASPSPTSSSSGAIKVTTSIGFALFAAVVMTIAMA